MNMRKALSDKEGERRKFSAIFSRFGSKVNYHGYAEETILLTHVVDLENQQVVADHIWFNYTKSFREAALTPGKKVKFEARIKKYVKGYVNTRYKIDQRHKDFKLSHPTKVETIEVG